MASAAAVIPFVELLDADEFLELYDRDEGGFREYELFDGEVVERPMTSRVHDGIKNAVSLALNLYFLKVPGYISLVETTFKLGPRRVFTPDLAVVEINRWNAMVGNFAVAAPDIAFEVVSSDRADRLKFKTDSYLECGSGAVCCIYPSQRRITVVTPGRLTEFQGDDSLQFPAILPGFEMPLSAVFAILGNAA